MVLRKPYRFLIKHFRFIHLILAIMSTYLLTRTNNLINFFNDYINNSETLIGAGTSSEYFTSSMLMLSVGMIIGTLIILFIMKMKDKPIIFYIINLIVYSFVIIIYLYDNSIIQKLELKSLDIRTIKLSSDFTFICFLVQTVSTVVLYIRAIGFNIKRFNFEHDLKFDINESDNEEFEFDVDIDKNKIKRKLNKKIRDFKYSYHENKFLINIALAIVLVAIGIFIYINKTIIHKIYKENQNITTSEYIYNVEESYLLDTDYNNNKITDNQLVVTKIKIAPTNNSVKKFEPARVLLYIGKVRFNPTTKFKNYLLDLGKVYNGNKLSTGMNEYILVFEIPKKYASKKKTFVYSDPYKGDFKTRLSSKKLNKQINASAKLKEQLKLNSEVIKNIDFSILNYNISDKIKSTYTFCETANICYESYEYITPTLSDNYTKSILKIESNVNFNDQKIANISDLSDLIETFGTIKYTINNEERVMDTKIKEVTPLKSKENGVYYFEIYDEIKHASKISLVLTIRNSTYEYVLKS